MWSSLVLVGLFALPSLAAQAADWPQFLGPHRSGVSAQTLPEKLPAESKPLWTRQAGAGFSGALIVGGKALLWQRQGDEMVLEAVALESGKALWKSSHPTDYVDSFGFDPGPRAVPAVADGRVITYGPEGKITAWDLEGGRQLWQVDAAATHQSPAGFFGRAPSPLIVGSSVVLAIGGRRGEKAAGLLALDAASGRELWQGVEDEAGYASPMDAGDGRLLCWMRNSLWWLEAKSGRVLASQRLRSSMDASVNAATPQPWSDRGWLISAGYGVGAHLLKPREGGFDLLWQREGLLDCHYSTPLIIGDWALGFHGRQESGRARLRCVDLKKGELLWEDEDGVPGGTLLACGNRALVLTEQGELWLLEVAGEATRKLGKLQVCRAGHRSHAAYGNGVLLLRDGSQWLALRLGAS